MMGCMLVKITGNVDNEIAIVTADTEKILFQLDCNRTVRLLLTLPVIFNRLVEL